MTDTRLRREAVANRPKHWIRLATACNSHCLFCLDSDTPRGLFLPLEQVRAELRRGLAELGAERVIFSGGEATLHPQFLPLVAEARELGYDRVQVVTNGWKFADRAFYRAAVEAGLGEITFSLHGHTPALHNRLTRHPGSFQRLMKGLIRAVRRRELIVNVDVVINQQNVAVLDKIVELAASVGVREFDLLHVIPQADAFEHREQLFYDVREHLPVLHKVFRLNEHPQFTVWTNRFPVSYLEGLEELIQDPHKMLDEINGRRVQVRRYLDTGEPLDCRQPERCQHCFIEPLCHSIDDVVAGVREAAMDIWWVGHASWDGELPAGCTLLGISGELRGAGPVYWRGAPADVGELPACSVLVATEPAQLDAWLGRYEVDVELNRRTGPWLLERRSRVAEALERTRLVQPHHESLAGAVEGDLRDPAAFFTALGLPVATSGLPACAAPGARLAPSRRLLRAGLFDAAGRLSPRSLAQHHVSDRYAGKSVRCADCRLDARCEGLPIHMIRDQGLELARPLIAGAWADEAEQQLVALYPTPPLRPSTGRPPEAPAPPLPGFAGAAQDEVDPVAQAAAARRRRRRGAESG